MERQKKIKTVQVEEKFEVKMTQSQELEVLESEMDRVRVELENTKRELEEKKHELKSMPAREVSEDEMIIIKKQQSGFSKNSGLKEKIEKQKEFDNQKVMGKFINRRAPGQLVKLTYMKYEDDPVKWYTFEDGKVYTIPRGFADQINEHYHTPMFIKSDAPMDPSDPQSQIHGVDTSNKKYAFVPVNF